MDAFLGFRSLELLKLCNRNEEKTMLYINTFKHKRFSKYYEIQEDFIKSFKNSVKDVIINKKIEKRLNEIKKEVEDCIYKDFINMVDIEIDDIKNTLNNTLNELIKEDIGYDEEEIKNHLEEIIKLKRNQIKVYNPVFGYESYLKDNKYGEKKVFKKIVVVVNSKLEGIY